MDRPAKAKPDCPTTNLAWRVPQAHRHDWDIRSGSLSEDQEARVERQEAPGVGPVAALGVNGRVALRKHQEQPTLAQ